MGAGADDDLKKENVRIEREDAGSDRVWAPPKELALGGCAPGPEVRTQAGVSLELTHLALFPGAVVPPFSGRGW